MRLRSFGLFAVCAAIFGSPASLAKLVGEVTKIPVFVKNTYGKEVAQTVVVTVFFESTAPKPYSVLVHVLGHGRAPEATGRMAMGRAR